jgi:hypothetical protein
MAARTGTIKDTPDRRTPNAKIAGGRNLADRRAHEPTRRYKRLNWVP